MPKGIKQAKIADQQAAIDQARSEFFSGVTKSEAAEVFKLLSLLSTFPGAVPPDPLSGCEVIWSSTLRVSDSIVGIASQNANQQVFDVQVTHHGMLFKYLSNAGSIIQLSDSTFMAFANWDLEDERLCKRALDKLMEMKKVSKQKNEAAIAG